MFKAIREAKARVQVGDLVEQITALLTYNGIRPTPGHWDDPYLYGYFTGMTTIPLKVGSRGKLEGESISAVQAWGWETLTGISSKSYFHRVIALTSKRDAEYVRGQDLGILWGVLVTGTARRDNAIVAEAIEAGRAVGTFSHPTAERTQNDLQDAAAYVMTRDLYAYLREASTAAA